MRRIANEASKSICMGSAMEPLQAKIPRDGGPLNWEAPRSGVHKAAGSQFESRHYQLPLPDGLQGAFFLTLLR